MAQLARVAAGDEAFGALARRLGSLPRIDAFVRSHYRYRDEAEEIVRTPQFMVHDLDRIGYMEGDCDDVATLYAAFGRALGYPARLVAIRYNPQNPNFEHVFTEILDAGEWITFDATVEPGTQIRSVEEMIEEV